MTITKLKIKDENVKTKDKEFSDKTNVLNNKK